MMTILKSFIRRAVEPMLRPSKLMRKSQLALLPAPSVDAVFVGDSITEGGVWNEWFPDISTANRGVSGDRTIELVERLDTVGSGRAVLIMIGTNDIAWGTDVDVIATNLRQILNSISAASPGSQIYVQSVLPRRASSFRRRIEDLNKRYAETTKEADATYLDLYDLFATPRGTLRDDLTEDGVHLNGTGYRIWADYLRRTVAVLAETQHVID